MDIVNPYVPGEADLIRERKTPELVPADRLTRLFAVLVDSGMIIVLAILMALIIPRFMGRNESSTSMAVIGVFVVAALLAWLGYNLKLMQDFGQTFGKRTLGIKVVRTDGSRLGLGRWITHRVLVIGLIGAIPYIGWIVSLADNLFIFRESRQCLHDQIADTMVVQA